MEEGKDCMWKGRGGGGGGGARERSEKGGREWECREVNLGSSKGQVSAYD